MAHSNLVRGASITLSVFLLLPTIVLAAGSAPIGTLRCEGTVYVESAKAPFETVVFSGDKVATADGRATLSLSQGTRVVLERGSSAALVKSQEGLTVGLEKGQLALRSDPQTPVQVETSGLTLAATGRFPSLAEVAMLSDGAVSLSVRRGAVVVRNLRAEPVVVRAGNFIVISPRLANQDPAKTPGTGAHGGKTLGESLRTFKLGGLSHGASVAVIGGLVVGVAAAVAIPMALDDEPSTPVSPAAP